MYTRMLADVTATPEIRRPPITSRRERARGCCGRERVRSCCGRERARDCCARGASCAASGWECQRGRGRGAAVRAAEARRRVRVLRVCRGGARRGAGERWWRMVREAGRPGRARLSVCLGVRAERCSPPYCVRARLTRYHRRHWMFITPSVAGYHPSCWLIITPSALLVAVSHAGDGARLWLAVYLP